MINTRTLQNFVITIVVFFGSFSLSAEAADSRNRAADFAASRTKPLTPGAIASLKALRERERLRTEQEAQSIQSRPLQMDANGQVFKKDFTPELNTATTARSGALKSLSSNSIPRPSQNNKKTAAKNSPITAQSLFFEYEDVRFPIIFDEFDYVNNLRNYVVDHIYEPNADSIAVDFSFVHMESGVDYVRVMSFDEFDRAIECDRFTGNDPDGDLSAYCPGNYVEIWVTTDSSIDGRLYDGFEIWGYRAAYNVANTAPVAIASSDRSSAGINRDIQFYGFNSFDPDTFEWGDSIDGYLWEFGDGTSSSLVNPIKYYNRSGTYRVRLTVWDTQDDFNSESYVEMFIVIQPVADPVLGDTTLTQTNATFRWTAGDNNTAGFVAKLVPGNRNDLTCNGADDIGFRNQISYSVQPGTQYTFIICAYQGNEYSLGWLRYITTPQANPGVNNLQASAPTNTGVNFTWSGNGATINYLVNFQLGDLPNLACAGSPQASGYSRNDLIPGTEYTIAVCGRNSDGVTTAPVRLKIETTIPAPTLLVNTQRLSTRLNFTWNGHANTNKYWVAFSPGNGSNLNCANANTDNGTSKSYSSANNLVPGAQYSILVCAQNRAGVRVASAPLTVTTLAIQGEFRISISREASGIWVVSFPATNGIKYELFYSREASGPYQNASLILPTFANGRGTFRFVGGEGENIQFFQVKATPL